MTIAQTLGEDDSEIRDKNDVRNTGVYGAVSLGDGRQTRSLLCGCDIGKVKDYENIAQTVAAVFCVVGVCLTVIGFLVPTDYDLDSLTAREAEIREQYYANMRFYLDVVLAVGAVLVGVGCVIISGLMMRSICLGEYDALLEEDAINIGRTRKTCSSNNF